MTETFGSHIDALLMRRVFGIQFWKAPEKFGPDGWKMVAKDNKASVIATCFDWTDGVEYIHASIARESMPTYEDLCQLHKAVFGQRYAYQQFVPISSHVNIHAHALHLWGRLDGKPILPDFGAEFGSI